MSELRTAAASDLILRDCLDAFPEVVFAVTGRCMSPDLAEGDRVRLVSPHRRPPRVGRTAGWRTQADRAVLLDPSLAAEDVLGTVVAVEGRRYERRPARAFLSLARAVVTRFRLAASSLR